MRQNPNEGDPASDRVHKIEADLAGAVGEWSQSNSELLIALAASVDRNESVQEKFRNAVVRRLARLEARARVLQLSDIVNSLKSVDRAVEQERGVESMVSELSGELERKMLKEISAARDERAK